MARNERYEDDDGRVVASMSDIEPTPILIPRFDRLQGDRKEARPDFEDPELRIAWKAIGPAIDQDAARYQEVCEKRRQAAEKRWDTSQQKSDAFACT